MGLLGLYLIVGIGIYLLQEKLIFLPDELERDFEFRFEKPFTEHFLEMKDGAEINVLNFHAQNSKGLILYFHGNAGSLERWGNIVDPFVDMGYDVLIMDYRGYGKSSGQRSQQAMLSDADELYEFALSGSQEKKMIVFGRSLGCAFASHVGGENNPSKIILETPFYSLEDVAKKVVPIYPTNLLLRFNFKNHQSLQSANAPIYIFQGTEDEIVPFESAKKLHDSIKDLDADFIVIKGGEHNNLSGFEQYWVTMSEILGQ